MKPIGFALIALILLPFSTAHAAKTMAAFPPPEEGMTRYVLQLPEQKEESLYKVELIIGKTVRLDPQNQYFFIGRIEQETIHGWGFPRYVVNKVGPMAGTLIGVAPNTPQVERFITLRGKPYLIRYNSRLPVVVYVPNGFQVRYRLWKASETTLSMEEG